MSIDRKSQSAKSRLKSEAAQIKTLIASPSQSSKLTLKQIETMSLRDAELALKRLGTYSPDPKDIKKVEKLVEALEKRIKQAKLEQAKAKKVAAELAQKAKKLNSRAKAKSAAFEEFRNEFGKGNGASKQQIDLLYRRIMAEIRRKKAKKVASNAKPKAKKADPKAKAKKAASRAKAKAKAFKELISEFEKKNNVDEKQIDLLYRRIVAEIRRKKSKAKPASNSKPKPKAKKSNSKDKPKAKAKKADSNPKPKAKKADSKDKPKAKRATNPISKMKMAQLAALYKKIAETPHYEGTQAHEQRKERIKRIRARAKELGGSLVPMAMNVKKRAAPKKAKKD